MSTPIDLLDRLTAKTKWAKKQISDLEAALLKAFPGGHSGQYDIRFEDDANTRERTYYVVSIPNVPLEISLRAGDILNNLRCSLDHLTCHLVRKNGGSGTRRSFFALAANGAGYVASRCHATVTAV